MLQVAADTTPPALSLTASRLRFAPGGSSRLTVAASGAVGVAATSLTVDGVALPLDASGQAVLTRLRSSSMSPNAYRGCLSSVLEMEDTRL